MAENSNFPRYDHPVLAWEYDQRQPTPLAGELEWYAKYAALSGGQILELACGSGRLTIPLALAGYRIDGVDRSETMLDRLRTKLKDCDTEVRQRVRLYCADMTEFSSGETYQMVILAYNSLQYLEKKETTQTFFSRMPRLLQKGGHFLFVVRRFSQSYFMDGKRVVYDNMKSPTVDREKGLSIGCRFTAYYEATNSQVVSEETYEIVSVGSQTQRIFQVSRSPAIETAEYLTMLGDAGLVAQVYGGYDESPEDGKSRELCFVCRRE